MRALSVVLTLGGSLVLNTPVYANGAVAPLVDFGERGATRVAYDKTVSLDVSFAESADLSGARVYVNGKEQVGAVDASRRQQKIDLPVDIGKNIVEVSIVPRGAAQQAEGAEAQVHRVTVIRTDHQVREEGHRKVEFKSAAHKEEIINRFRRGDGLGNTSGD